MKFRKKPVVVEAVQWNATKVAFDAIMAMGLTKWKPGSSGDTFTIETLEGDHLVSKGDWVIRGVAGEFYPCKPDIFALTYDPAEEETKIDNSEELTEDSFPPLEPDPFGDRGRELDLLRLRNLISQQEMMVEGAKRETLLGGWTFNWNQPHAELQGEIDDLIAHLQKKAKP
jgi:hypothetical protein